MPQPGESRTTPGSLTGEQALWLGVLLQQVSDSCGVEEHPQRQQDRAAARAFLGKPGRDLHLLLAVAGVEPETWHQVCLPQLERAWRLVDAAGGRDRRRGSHAAPRLLKAAAEAREAEKEQRRRERLEEARRGWRQALERCGYSADLGSGSYLGASEASRAS